ncbi:glycosyltransferase family 2 protein [bacterium]|nr:glycosyltransferase family 2 protein [bacterium]
MMNEISVVIPNWNGERFLPLSLGSLKKSRFKDLETIVVNNGSTDKSVEYIRKNHPDVRLINLDKNYGFAFACNRGIEASKGKYVFLLNNDMEVDKDCLDELFKTMEEHPQCSAAAVKMMFYDKRDKIYNTGDLLQITGGGGQRGFGEIDRGQYEKEEYVQGVTAGAGFYRKSVFDKIGLLDEDYFIFSEDVDWNFRATLAGYKAIYAPTALCYHIGTATVGFNSDRYVYLSVRNDFFNMSKDIPFVLMLKYLNLILTRYLQLIKNFSLCGKGWIIFKGRISNLLYFPKTMIKRFKIQSQRKIGLKGFENIVVRRNLNG